MLKNKKTAKIDAKHILKSIPQTEAKPPMPKVKPLKNFEVNVERDTGKINPDS